MNACQATSIAWGGEMNFLESATMSRKVSISLNHVRAVSRSTPASRWMRSITDSFQ
jgi:hypothetical protein